MLRTTTPQHTLRLTSWNAQGGLRDKRPDIIQYVTDYKIDILLLQETWLQPTQSFKIPNFITYRTDRTHTQGGGTAIVIRKTIPHSHIPDNRQFQFEKTTIQIGTRTGPINITSIYNRPRTHIDENELDNIIDKDISTIIAGDFNAKMTTWGCKCDNRPGKDLHNYILNRPRLQLLIPPEPTHYLNDEPNDILDYVIHTTNLSVSTPHPRHELISDHLPIIFAIHITPYLSHTTPPTQKLTNWKLYRTFIAKKIKPTTDLHSHAQIDKAIDHFNHHISHSLRKATITTKPSKPQLPDDITHLIRQKRRLEKTYYRTRRPEDKRLYKQTKRLLHDTLVRHEKTKWDKTLRDVTMKQPQNIWKITRLLKTPDIPISPIKLHDRTTYDPQTIAESFASSLSTKFSNSTSDPYHPTQALLNFVTAPPLPPAAQTPWTFSDKDVRDELRLLDATKAAGSDRIPTAALKHLTRNAIDHLTNIFNACIRLTYFPTKWKLATVIMIPKPMKDPKDINSYRPISLLPTTSKILERLILRRLTPLLTNVIKKTQFGFTPNKSAPLQTLRLTMNVAKTLQDRQRQALCLLTDFSNAFDSVSHDLLLLKIRPHIPNFLFSLLQSYLSQRYLQVRFQTCISSPHPIPVGVPQGAVLSPTLFSIFINDIPVLPHVDEYLYADDLAYVTKTGKDKRRAYDRLRQTAQQLTHWATDNKIVINPAKCQAIIFTWQNKRTPINEPPIRINNADIPWTKDVKYLGLTIDHKLLWTTHVTEKTKKAHRLINALTPLFTHKNIDKRTKLYIYKTYIKPIVTYSCETWATTFQTNYLRLTRLDNRIVRLIFKPRPDECYLKIKKDNDMTPLTTEVFAAAKNRIKNAIANPSFKKFIRPHLSFRNRFIPHNRKKHPLDIFTLPIPSPNP